jgi:hypothetical protein
MLFASKVLEEISKALLKFLRMLQFGVETPIIPRRNLTSWLVRGQRLQIQLFFIIKGMLNIFIVLFVKRGNEMWNI